MPKPAIPAAKPATKQRVQRIIRALKRTYPDAVCALHHEDAYELLVATILSAQCTDERVNAVTPNLFRDYPTPAALAAAKPKDVERIIRSLGFFRAKTKSLIGMARGIEQRPKRDIPRELGELVALPGVGRKTANVVLGTAFGIPSGIVVDTHVKRISNLLGLTTSKNPEQIERDLMEVVPRNEWIDWSHRLIHHGRRICVARRPKCLQCPLLAHCPRIGLPPLEAE